MSAYICNPNHHKALAIWAVAWQHGQRRANPCYLKHRHEQFARLEHITTDRELATAYANILYRENIRSVACRYPDDGWTDLPGPIEKPENITIAHRDMLSGQYLGLKAVEILKLVNGLSYQSCETDNWEQTAAYHLLEAIKGAAIRTLPGYDDAPWEFPYANEKAA